MDQIKIENLKVFAFHGVYSSEKDKGQNFYVNATLYTDFSEVGDKIEKSTDYSEVCNTIKETMTSRNYDLIETVAEKVANAILINFPRIPYLILE